MPDHVSLRPWQFWLYAASLISLMSGALLASIDLVFDIGISRTLILIFFVLALPAIAIQLIAGVRSRGIVFVRRSRRE